LKDLRRLRHQLSRSQQPKLPVSSSTKLYSNVTDAMLCYEEDMTDFLALSEAAGDFDVSPDLRSLTFAAPRAPFSSLPAYSSLQIEASVVVPISIPTLHILGAKDEFLSLGQLVVELCEARSANVLLCDAAHELPRQPTMLDNLAAQVLALAEKATWEH